MTTSRARTSRPSTPRASAQGSNPRTRQRPAASSRECGPLLGGDAPLDAKAREDLIREAAYFHAERRGFQAGHEVEDWLAAEREFDEWLATRAAPHRYARR